MQGGWHCSQADQLVLALEHNSHVLKILCRCASLPVEERPVALRKGQQRSKEYLAMNPLGKVPCLEVRVYPAL